MPIDSGRISHWDLLLEQPTGFGEKLLAFAAPTPPEEWGHTVVVEQLPEHRLVYLDYQGPVSGNRGSVSRVLDGTIQWQECSATSLIAAVQSPGIRADTVKVHMKQGELRIRKLTNHLGDGRQWELELRLTTVNCQRTTDNGQLTTSTWF